MLSIKRVQPKKFFVLVAVMFLLFTGVYAYTVVSHHFTCQKSETGECLPKGMCVAPNDGIVPCSLLNSDGSYKQKGSI